MRPHTQAFHWLLWKALAFGLGQFVCLFFLVDLLSTGPTPSSFNTKGKKLYNCFERKKYQTSFQCKFCAQFHVCYDLDHFFYCLKKFTRRYCESLRKFRFKAQNIKTQLCPTESYWVYLTKTRDIV